MIDATQLQEETTMLLEKKVLAVGIFDASLNFGTKALAPAAAGVATYLGTKLLENKVLKYEGAGATTTATVAGVAGAIGTKQFLYHPSAQSKGLTPVMVCAITANRIYLLDWNGNHHKSSGKGKSGPTRILFDFTRAHSTIKNRKRGMVHHIVDIKEDGHHARIECNLGATQSNKNMNKNVLKLLKESSSQ
jgi:hypothetical protein